MNVGDKVQWVPSIEHAREEVPGKGFAWEHNIMVIDPGKAERKAVPASTEKIRNAIEVIKRDKSQKPYLVAVKPRLTYPATVEEVSGDTVSLAILNPCNNVTLRYANVKVDPNKAPGTCHVEAE